MSFADAYLLKAGLRELLIKSDPHPDLKISVTIPVYNESGLERCLDSLFVSAGNLDGLGRAEVLILINAPADAPTEIMEQNYHTHEATRDWIAHHPHPLLDFHLLMDHSFGKKEAGVGLARKILMDEAVRRFGALGILQGIIASMDADAVVEPNYLSALLKHFNTRQRYGQSDDIGGQLPEGCSIYFEHPLEPSGFEVHEPEIYDAIAQYELHLRYYLQSVRYTGYPYAYHTVGSSFAVRADVYCMEGGMNRRQGGEDFYFIQKVAQRGWFSECNETCVIPSARPSDRVPFGTGPVVRRLSKSGEALTTYDPRPFGMLRQLFSDLEVLYTGAEMDKLMDSLPRVLTDFLKTQQFEDSLLEIRGNSASYPAFRKRFWRWFNTFRIMKFLHFARERGYPDVTVGEASMMLLEKIHPDKAEFIAHNSSFNSGRLIKSYLAIFRKFDQPTI